MTSNEQGVVQKSRLLRLLAQLLLLLCFCSATAGTGPHEPGPQSHRLYIIHTPDNSLHSSIIQKISDILKLKRPDINVSGISYEEKTREVDNENDMIIGIGAQGIQSADANYPNNRKLFISTDQNKYKLHSERNKNDAILYMAQPYCRQIRFIRLLNRQWKTISILNSATKPIDNTAIQQCANEHDIKIYMVSTAGKDDLSKKIKHALHYSDILLALPDSNIYNSKTVKNILLTSYRYRKPVIAFSKNFVRAGALAAIYSDTDNIAQSASRLIEQRFDTGTLLEPVNHPGKYEIGINKQVFRALDIPIPDVDTLKKTLDQTETGNTGKLQ
jgi:hypothetical protein